MNCAAIKRLIVAALSQNPACEVQQVCRALDNPMIERRHTEQWCHIRPNGEIFCDGDEPKTFLEPQ